LHGALTLTGYAPRTYEESLSARSSFTTLGSALP
jgi:hypothetical protein